MSEHVYRQHVADLASAQDVPKAEVAASLVEFVLAGHAAGEPWADQTMQRWEREGAARDYSAAHKSLHSITYIRRDGRRVRKTTSYSRAVRSENSGDIVAMQMQSWWTWTRAEVAEQFADIGVQTARIGEVRNALRQLLEVMDRHPECETAREAWLAEGRALDEIDLGETAS